MKKFKRFTLIVITFIISGCSVSNTTLDLTQDDDYNFKSSYKQLNGGKKMMTRTLFLETGIISLYNVDESGSVVLFYYDSNTSDSFILNSDPSKQCSIAKYKSCSSYIESPLLIEYYKNKLYSVTTEINEETDESFMRITEMDLDGTKRKSVLELKLTDSFSFDLNFHENYAYLGFGNQILRYNVDDWIEETILNQELLNFSTMSFLEDSLMINAHNYTDTDGILYPNVYLQIDLNSLEKTRILQDLLNSSPTFQPYFIYNNKFFYFDIDTESNMPSLYILDLETDKVVNLKRDGLILFNPDLEHNIFVLGEHHSNRKYAIYDFDGNLLDEIQGDPEDTWIEYLDEGALYTVNRRDGYTLYRHPIVDGKFQESEIVYTPK